MDCDRGFKIDAGDGATRISVLSQLKNRDFIQYSPEDLAKLFLPFFTVEYADLILSQLDAFPLLNYLSRTCSDEFGESRRCSHESSPISTEVR